MKTTGLTILSIVLTLTCFGQTLFFDNLNNSTWVSGPNVTDAVVESSKQIHLGKIKLSIDSLRENVTVWNFKDDLLTIKFFDNQQKKATTVATYKYEANRNKGILTIYINNKPVDFQVGITSTGDNALLIRKKEKK